jgi:predicted Zn-dependent protease
MKKFLVFVPFLLLVVMTSGCIDNNTNSTVPNSTFNVSGVDFTYPGNWTEMTLDEVKNISVNPSNAIGGVQSDDQVIVVVHKFSAGGMTLSDLKTSMADVYSSSNISEISTVTINGKDALVATYSDSTYKTKIIVILVGNSYYTIEMQTPIDNYNAKESILNSIQNSIQIS